MPAVIARLTVENRERWHRAFRARARLRSAVGIRASLVFEDADDPDALFVIHQVEDIKRVRSFLATSAEAGRDVEATVTDRQTWFLREV